MDEKTVAPDVTGINKQSPKPQVNDFDGKYAVHSVFHTIQGEGPFSGDPACFVRLRDCNLQCPMCDTEYTSSARGGDFTAEEICAQVKAATSGSKTTLVVITGGEPFRQNLTQLVRELRENAFRVQVETNGTLKPHATFCAYAERHPGIAIVVSPKASHVDPWLQSHAIAFKYVLTAGFVSDEDGLPNEVLGRRSSGIARPPKWMSHVYVQPADQQNSLDNDANIKATIASCMTFGYRLQLQTHKYLGVE